MTTFLIIIIALALIFDYINGFHDAANSIATVVSTKVLTPFQAVLWAALFNFLAFFIFKDHGVANTVAKTVNAGSYDLVVVLAGVIAAICWNLLTRWYGIPSSSSHTLIGGFAGAAVAHAIAVHGFSGYAGEDGTTHQPIEQLVSLRSIPNTLVLRPADANETVQAWRVALEYQNGPVVIVLTRQGLPIIDQTKYTPATELEKGAYILSDAEKPAVILMATGSEVSLVMDAQAKLKEQGIAARVVSMPSWELFEKQDAAYKEKVLPRSIRKRLAVEAGSPLGWHKYVTDEGGILGMTTFGESAPAGDLMKFFGFTVDNVVKKVKELLS